MIVLMPVPEFPIQALADDIVGAQSPFQRVNDLALRSEGVHNTLGLEPIDAGSHVVRCVASHLVTTGRIEADRLGVEDDGTLARTRIFPGMRVDAHYVAIDRRRERALLYSLSTGFQPSDQRASTPFAPAIDAAIKDNKPLGEGRDYYYEDPVAHTADGVIYGRRSSDRKADVPVLLTDETQVRTRRDGRINSFETPTIVGLEVRVFGAAEIAISAGQFLQVCRNRILRTSAENLQLPVRIPRDGPPVISSMAVPIGTKPLRGSNGQLYAEGADAGHTRLRHNPRIPLATLLEIAGSDLVWQDATADTLKVLRSHLLALCPIDAESSHSAVVAEARAAVQQYMAEHAIHPGIDEATAIAGRLGDIDKEWPPAPTEHRYSARPREEFTLERMSHFEG